MFNNSLRVSLDFGINKLQATLISNTVRSNARLKLAKKQAKAKQYPEAEFWLFENYSLSFSTLSSKNNKIISKNCTKNKCVCFYEVIWLMAMKMKLKMKNGSHRYDINRPRPRYGQKYTKYKICLSKMMVICVKQHFSNIWNSIYEKVKQRWGWFENEGCLWRQHVFYCQHRYHGLKFWNTLYLETLWHVIM